MRIKLNGNFRKFSRRVERIHNFNAKAFAYPRSGMDCIGMTNGEAIILHASEPEGEPMPHPVGLQSKDFPNRKAGGEVVLAAERPELRGGMNPDRIVGPAAFVDAPGEIHITLNGSMLSEIIDAIGAEYDSDRAVTIIVKDEKNPILILPAMLPNTVPPTEIAAMMPMRVSEDHDAIVKRWETTKAIFTGKKK